MGLYSIYHWTKVKINPKHQTHDPELGLKLDSVLVDLEFPCRTVCRTHQKSGPVQGEEIPIKQEPKMWTILEKGLCGVGSLNDEKRIPCLLHHNATYSNERWTTRCSHLQEATVIVSPAELGHETCVRVLPMLAFPALLLQHFQTQKLPHVSLPETVKRQELWEEVILGIRLVDPKASPLPGGELFSPHPRLLLRLIESHISQHKSTVQSLFQSMLVVQRKKMTQVLLSKWSFSRSRLTSQYQLLPEGCHNIFQ